MSTNKKGRKLLDDVEKEWAALGDRGVPQHTGMDNFKKETENFIGQIKGQSTGEGWVAKNDFQMKKMKGFLMKRGIFDSVGGTTATAEQIAQRKKKDAKLAAKAKKMKEKRQRGSATLAKRKMEVPAYLQKLEELKKYKKGFKILLEYYNSNSKNKNRMEMGGYGQLPMSEELKKLGLVKYGG